MNVYEWESEKKKERECEREREIERVKEKEINRNSSVMNRLGGRNFISIHIYAETDRQTETETERTVIDR